MATSTAWWTPRNSAQAWAYRQIAFRYADRYRELYLEEKGDGKGAAHNRTARVHAVRRLAREHPDEYRRLREQRLAELKEAAQW